MKLRNKKTGEVITLIDHTFDNYNSLAELNEEWEDYEEPKEIWWLDNEGNVNHGAIEVYDTFAKNIEIGNYFKAKEEAEKAVERLRAWKRLKDRGFRFKRYKYSDILEGTIGIEAQFDNDGQAEQDLAFLFGGEE